MWLAYLCFEGLVKKNVCQLRRTTGVYSLKNSTVAERQKAGLRPRGPRPMTAPCRLLPRVYVTCACEAAARRPPPRTPRPNSLAGLALS
ncbi:hypothetical protein EVAR_68502_1 [Eumeta japonica]|uniref:Uncharacterized protein n=1 Tax=Eumeta variegata TaxID=151549 RepID=A0A4C2A3R9_EUMVA|nr:hypothetical protein EVAR_68502_1 [Eumeta japonica]